MPLFKFFASVFVAIFLILSDTKFSYLDNIKLFVANFISPIYLLVSLPTKVYDWIDEQGTTKQTLLNKNKQLSYELARANAHLQTRRALLLENQKLTQLLGATYAVDNQDFVLANVSNISQSRLKRQIIINKGSYSGLKLGQVALGAKGVIGQITQVGALYSTIQMITDPTQYVPVKNARNGIRGISKGIALHQDGLVVNFVESDADVKVGDVFLSSNIGGKFPADYPVGKVTHVEKDAENVFLHIELDPIQQMQDLEFILIKK